MGMHEQGHTQSVMEEFDRIANDKKMYVASSTERTYHRDQYKVVRTDQGGGSDTTKTEELPGYKKMHSKKGKTSPDNPQNPMLTSGHRGLHGGILRHHKHCDNHNHLPHLMSRHSS